MEFINNMWFRGSRILGYPAIFEKSRTRVTYDKYMLSLSVLVGAFYLAALAGLLCARKAVRRVNDGIFWIYFLPSV